MLDTCGRVTRSYLGHRRDVQSRLTRKGDLDRGFRINVIIITDYELGNHIADRNAQDARAQIPGVVGDLTPAKQCDTKQGLDQLQCE